jgi:HD domain
MNAPASWAEHLAQSLLQESLPRRWAHVQGVATRARSLAPVLGADGDLIEAAAWLHDTGCAPGLAITGLHALDGARYLRDTQHADAMLCRLVAHHSYAIVEAAERGLADILSLDFEPAPDGSFRRAHLLRHDNQPGRRPRPSRKATRRDTPAIRPQAPRQPVNPACHAADPRRSRAGSPPSRPNRITQAHNG